MSLKRRNYLLGRSGGYDHKRIPLGLQNQISPSGQHHQNLTMAGVHQIQNLNLTEMAAIVAGRETDQDADLD